MKKLLVVLALCSFNAGCRSLTGEEAREIHELAGALDFFHRLGECLLDNEESTPDEPGWITPAHPND